MSQYFPTDTFVAMVLDRYDELRSDAWSTGHKGVVTHIAKGAAAIKAEFARLEAIYKVPGDKPKDLDIPNDEMEKLFQLSVDVAAMCQMLATGTVPSRTRQMRLSDLPENCIAIREDGETKVLNEEDTKKVMSVIASALLMARMDQEIEKKGGQRSIGEIIEGNKDAIEAAVNQKPGGQGEVTINVNKAKKPGKAVAK